MNNNRKIARKYTDNKEKIRVHKVFGRIDEGKRYEMKRRTLINGGKSNETQKRNSFYQGKLQ